MLPCYSYAFENTEGQNFYYMARTSTQLNGKTLLRRGLETTRIESDCVRFKAEWREIRIPGWRSTKSRWGTRRKSRAGHTGREARRSEAWRGSLHTGWPHTKAAGGT